MVHAQDSLCVARIIQMLMKLANNNETANNAKLAILNIRNYSYKT